MANLVLSFSIEGQEQLIRKLEGIQSDFKNWTSEFNQVGQLLKSTSIGAINTQGAEIGESWPPLAASTIRQKQRMGFPLAPLIRTRSLLNSFSFIAGRMNVTLENKVPYFVYHQSRQPRTKIPRRLSMKIDEKRKQLIVKIFQTSVKNKVAMRGFNV